MAKNVIDYKSTAHRARMARIGPAILNYLCLGVADLASSVLHGTSHRSSGALAAHVLEVMHAILRAGVHGRSIRIGSRIEQPPSLSDQEAASYWRGPKP